MLHLWTHAHTHMHTCTYTHINTCTHMHIHTHAHTLAHAHTCTCTHTCTHTYTHMHATHMHMHTHTYTGADCHDVEDKHWINGHPIPIANPMSCYPLYQAHRKSWGINALGSIIVEVECEDGTVGVGKHHLHFILLRFN